MQKLVMAVDDEVGMLKLIEIILRRHQFAVGTATDAGAAFKLLETLTPDLFILDVMLPEVDGLELCRRLRASAETARTPVIILSALDDPLSIQKGLQAGADAYLSKTALHRTLITEVRKLLGVGVATADCA